MYLQGISRMSAPEQAVVKSIFALTDRKSLERTGALPGSAPASLFFA